MKTGKPKDRKGKRLKRKIREAEARVNRRIRARMDELMRDETFISQLDQDINRLGSEEVIRRAEKSIKGLIHV